MWLQFSNRRAAPDSHMEPIDLRRKAFSLTEVIIVIIILGIVAAAAAPSFSNSLNHYRLESVAQRLVNDLQAAQTLARISGRDVIVNFDLKSHQYSIQGHQSLDQPGEPHSVDLDSIPYGCPLDEMSWKSAEESEITKELQVVDNPTEKMSSLLRLVFDRFETVDQGGQIILRRGTQTRTITVSSRSGEIQLQ
jgi:type II secretion system protein H